MSDPLRIDSKDLFAPEVDTYIEAQEFLRRDPGEMTTQSIFKRIFFSSWFYLSLWCGLGALIGWAIVEPFFDDNNLERFTPADVLMFPLMAGFAALFLGAAEGVMCRNIQRAAISGSVGLGVGFVGSMVLWIPVEIFFALTQVFAHSFGKDQKGNLAGIPLLLTMIGRAITWAIWSVPTGLGQGIALREWKVTVNGAVGALLGGLLGGLMFDPIYLMLRSADGQATVSRGFGFTCIGLLVGLFVGLVEGWTKTAWLVMRKGPLAGKQFVLFKDTTRLGSSPKAEIYLFKDDAIEPTHAIIINRGGRFELEDQESPDGTYVNGTAVKRRILQNGDQIIIGKTVLEFSLRESQT